MRPLMVSLCALGLLAAEAGSAHAAWNNVFQTTLFGRLRRQQQTAQYYAAPVVVQSSPVPVAVAAPCTSCYTPCQTCQTNYIQRCYYQPVTTYQTQSYYEPVTSYQTSYYYAPVTSYRYSYYFDPCACGYQQVATPVVSYELRSQMSPVQSWVQRCATVPVTTYQKSCYLEPQTTCTTVGAPIPAAPPTVQVPASPPNIMENRQTPPPPKIDEQRYYPQQPNSAGKQTNFQFGTPPAVRPIAPPQPPVRLDRIVVGPDAHLEGQVVRSDNAPRANARVTFVSADRIAATQSVFANSAGRFHLSLPAGGWLVYLDAPDGTQFYHSRIDINGTSQTPVRLVSR
jgi:hypothetical protein